MGIQSGIERERHVRESWYLLVALAVAVFAHVFLGFDRAQTLGYAVSCFVMLNVVNFRTIFRRLPQERQRQRPAERDQSL